MSSLTLHDVSLSYGTDAPAVTGLNLSVVDGERLVLLGPSGCGKTTTLRLIAGLEKPQSGDIRFDEQSVLRTPPEQREAAMVFQSPSLFPFRTVGENVAFGLKQRNVPKQERPARVAEALASMQLGDLHHRWPAELSGGQQQRVALARALVVRPRILLLDEPLSSLDPELRGELQQIICDVQRAAGITTVMVTHDRAEARAMADSVAVMEAGAVVAVGLPADVLADELAR